MRASEHPILFLSIANGAGHTRAAQAIAEAVRVQNASIATRGVEVNEYMTPFTRFTHVTAYLWLVKYAPQVWDRIDRHQKQQTRTSPEWFYRRGCRKLFELVERIKPRALVATEVGCCEIAALIKRDLRLDVPLVAMSGEYDADRAWVQPEVDFYSAMTETTRSELIAHGAKPERVEVCGAPLEARYAALSEKPFVREKARRDVCAWLELDERSPIVLVAGGSEGMGRIEELTARLLQTKVALQIVVLAGRNAKLQAKLQKLSESSEKVSVQSANRSNSSVRLCVLGWTERVAELLSAADLLVSKLGTAFDEALAAGVPIVSMLPPPGSERVQYELIEKWKVGRAVKTVTEACAAVEELLRDEATLKTMRERARARGRTDAASKIARWLISETRSHAQDASEANVRGSVCDYAA